MLYFVYPYCHSEWDELKYSLRSLQKNFKEEFSVKIVGSDLPDWLNPAFFVRIKNKSDDRYVRVGKAYRWMMTHLRSQFFLCADDQYLLKPSNFADIKKVYYLEDLRDVKRPNLLGPWRTRLWDTNDRLKSMGFTNVYNYATHIPQLISPGFMQLIWNDFEFDEGNHLFTQAYNNCRELINPLKLDIKAGYYGSVKELGTRIEDHQVWLNHNDDGLTSWLKGEIQHRFPSPSRFEL